jgi:hypothetical protein
MFRCFVDDSGRDYKGPALVLGAWVARVDDWDAFSDVWDARLGLGKSIKYFKHTEAYTQTGCFAGFTEQEAAEKMVGLAQVLIGRPVAGFTCVVPQDEFNAYVKDEAIQRRGKISRELKDPFYIAFSELVPVIHAVHYHSGIRDRIDFVIDGNKSDKALRRCIDVFRDLKEEFKEHPWHPLMGEIIPGDDKDLLPLQAADLLAGQTRRCLVDLDVTPILKMYERSHVPVFGLYVGKDKLTKWREGFNKNQATDILTAIKNEREAKKDEE